MRSQMRFQPTLENLSEEVSWRCSCSDIHRLVLRPNRASRARDMMSDILEHSQILRLGSPKGGHLRVTSQQLTVANLVFLRAPLYGVPVRAIGRRIDRDDVLFGLLRHLCDWAVLHLTWSGREEADPRFLSFELFLDEELMEKCIRPAQKKYEPSADRRTKRASHAGRASRLRCRARFGSAGRVPGGRIQPPKFR